MTTTNRTQHTQHKPLRVVPDHGCHGYESHGVMFTRCEIHAPAGSRDTGAVLGQCVACCGGTIESARLQ